MTRPDDKPRLAGYRADHEHATCGHQDNADRSCPEPAVAHLWLREGGEDSALLSCVAHLPVAQCSGQLVLQHQVGPQCEMPGTAWDEDANVCIVDTCFT